MKILNLIKQNIFLTLAIIFSMLICVIGMTMTFFAIPFLWYFLIPFILLMSISILMIVAKRKFPLAAKIVSFVLNSLIILFQVFIFLVFYTILCITEADQIYINPDDYEKALKSIRKQERVLHFPSRIPQQARNVQLYKVADSIHGGCEIWLKFDIDKSYINKELEKNKFTKVLYPGSKNYEFFYSLPFDSRINLDGFIFYVIDDSDTIKLTEHYTPYSLGMGVNKEKTQIVYYYNNLQ